MMRTVIGTVLALSTLVPGVAQAQTEQVFYYHTDAIGSVRMITDGTGQVVARYDYLPFGEPCGSLCGTTSAPDKRQFAGKERDQETGFDYFGARHYAYQSGRFTVVDPVMGDPTNPQTWNRYVYALNNPLRYVDPAGLFEWDTSCGDDDTVCQANRQKFRDALNRMQEALSNSREGSSEYKELKEILNRIGTEGDSNHIRVAFSDTLSDFGETPLFGRTRTMTLNFGLLENAVGNELAGDARAALVTHEGRHTLQGVGTGVKWLFGARLSVERPAYNAESLFYKAIDRREPFGPLWDPTWPQSSQEMLRKAAVESLLRRIYGRP